MLQVRTISSSWTVNFQKNLLVPPPPEERSEERFLIAKEPAHGCRERQHGVSQPTSRGRGMNGREDRWRVRERESARGSSLIYRRAGEANIPGSRAEQRGAQWFSRGHRNHGAAPTAYPVDRPAGRPPLPGRLLSVDNVARLSLFKHLFRFLANIVEKKTNLILRIQTSNEYTHTHIYTYV